MPFLCLLTVELHFPTNADLKGKRKELSSLKGQLQRRFGAAVAETDHHDLWQRASLQIALLGRDARPLTELADRLQRHVDSRMGDLTRWERTLLATDELTGD